MKFGFESRHERRSALTETENKLYKELVLPQEAEAIQLEEFSDLYAKEIIEKDSRAVAELEAKFKAEAQNDPEQADWVRRGKIFEAIVRDQAEMSDWMGPAARVLVPSRYDDIMNGVDGIVEFEDEASKTHMILAVDVTESELGLDRKFQKIKGTIDSGSLSRVKYFKSDTMRGELTKVPRVVIGADRKSMHEVAELLLEFKAAQKEGASKTGKLSDRFKDIRNKLAESDMQYKVLIEMKAQIAAFRDYAAKVRQPEIKDAYERVLSILNSILEEKPEAELSETVSRLEKDGVFNLILDKSKKIGDYNVTSGGITKAVIK